jgi:metal-responsive CopG/Arc/MetJ family transcriptional regulator
MSTVRKVKISVSLGADVLGAVDRLAAREGATRSAVVERWLREASRRERVARLEEETAAYYDSLTVAEREDDAAWAAASSRAARRLRIDDGSFPGSGRPSRPRQS